MLETTQTQRRLAPGDMFSPVPLAIKTVRPHVSICPASAEQQATSRVWSEIVAGDNTIPHVAVFSDGSMTHAPEVIAAYRDIAATLPKDFLLIYLHRGAQAQSVNPLLPSLLHKTGHCGPSHALRRSCEDGLSENVTRFARAMTPSGGAALIIDDQQLRLATPGRIQSAEVHFHQFLKPGLTEQQTPVGAYQ